VLTLSYIDTALSQSAFRIYKCYIINIYITYLYIYIQGVSKKTEQIWNCSQFRKAPTCIRFYIYIASLGTYNVEWWKKFLELKFCEPGGGVFSSKLKMARAQNLKVVIIFWVNRWKICRLVNYCTKFQTIWFSLSPLTVHAKLRFS
jgi:hypothetical protein